MSADSKHSVREQLPSIVLLLTLVAVAFLVNFSFRKADFSAPGKLNHYGHRLQDPGFLAQAYRLKAASAPNNEHISLWIRYHHSQPPVKQWLPGVYDGTTAEIEAYLDSINEQEVSALGKAALLQRADRSASAMIALGEIDDWKQPQIQLLLGQIHEGIGKYPEAFRYYQQASVLKPDDGFAYRRCYQISIAAGWVDSTKQLIEAPQGLQFLPKRDVRFHYLSTGKFSKYLAALYTTLAAEIALVDLIAAALVMLAWLFYLVRIDPFTRHNRLWLGLVCGMGMFLALFTHVIYDLLEIRGLYLNGRAFNDMAFSILGIGLVEETIKAIPYLLFVRLRRIKAPFDHILCICASALGFSFSENLLYYDLGHLYLIHARALTAVVAHMCFSSILAYGVVSLSRKGQLKTTGILKWLFLAALVHGLYDFWVVSEWAQNLQAITIVIYVMATFCWVRMLNNTLNIAPNVSAAIDYPVARIQFYLVASLSLIFALEYLITGFHFGSKAANNSLWDALRFGGYLIIFLSTSLSNIRIRPGFREPILPWSR